VAAHRPPVHRRAAAALITGPVGHLYGGVADVSVMLARYLYARARGRM
jgi:hypothetical protein